MAAKRKTSGSAKTDAKKKTGAKKNPPAKVARKTAARKAASAAKHPAVKRKPARKAKSNGTIERAESAVVEIVKGIVPKARKVIRSVTKTISGKKK